MPKNITSIWVDSVDSEPMVPTDLRKLLALLTMVATVRPYNALAKASLVALHCKKHNNLESCCYVQSALQNAHSNYLG